MKKLSIRQVCLFFIAFMPVTKLFSLPSIIAKSSNEDMWICSLINLVVDFITLVLLFNVCKKTKLTFYELLNQSFGSFLAKTIYLFYFAYFMLKTILPLNEQKDFVEMTLYTLRPSILYFLPFFAVAFYFLLKPLRVLGRISDVIWVITLIGYVILFALSLSNTDFASILPVGANGSAKILHGSYLSLTWFGDSVYLLFFMGEFSCTKKDTKKIIGSFMVGAFIILSFMIIFYSIFTYIAYRQKFALTEISKYTAVINNIGRFDYVGIFLILISNIFALIMPLFMASRILNTVFNIKKRFISSSIVVAIQMFIMLVFSQKLYSIETFIINYLGFFFLFFGNVLPLITLLLTKRRKQYENIKN